MKKEKLNKIGLNVKYSRKLAKMLNGLLADYSVFYQNVRGYHWQIKGEKFFELHLKFEELYNDLFVKIDEIAERILTLGYEPEFRFTYYLKNARIKESGNGRNAGRCVKDILNSLRVLLIDQRQILDYASRSCDEGTAAMMSDYIREQEKLIWMYSAFLEK